MINKILLLIGSVSLGFLVLRISEKMLNSYSVSLPFYIVFVIVIFLIVMIFTLLFSSLLFDILNHLRIQKYSKVHKLSVITLIKGSVVSFSLINLFAQKVLVSNDVCDFEESNIANYRSTTRIYLMIILVLALFSLIVSNFSLLLIFLSCIVYIALKEIIIHESLEGYLKYFLFSLIRVNYYDQHLEIDGLYKDFIEIQSHAMHLSDLDNNLIAMMYIKTDNSHDQTINYINMALSRNREESNENEYIELYLLLLLYYYRNFENAGIVVKKIHQLKGVASNSFVDRKVDEILALPSLNKESIFDFLPSRHKVLYSIRNYENNQL